MRHQLKCFLAIVLLLVLLASLMGRPPYYFYELAPRQYATNSGATWAWDRMGTNALRVTFQWFVETNQLRYTPRDWKAVRVLTNYWFDAWTNTTGPETVIRFPDWESWRALEPPERGEDVFNAYSNLLMRVEYQGWVEDIWLESTPFLNFKRRWIMQKVYEQ